MDRAKIAIIGLGYVGLPLAIAFARKYRVVGFDINRQRIGELLKGVDETNEADLVELNSVLTADRKAITGLKITAELEDLSDCNIYIVTVPTPINAQKQPNLSFLLTASAMIGKHLKAGDLVIYESTVYPGCTEEMCVPVLEENSGLLFNRDFYCGYSPERINPGDKINTLPHIKKVTSGSNSEIAKMVDELYASIIVAGTYLAPSIRVAEAAKAIENAQRDVNISFVNELALIFDKMDIDTNDVLDAAATKWNFLNYRPGLVGGHCIGVDPYYLAHKAEQLGYTPNVILSGREVNDGMGVFVANKVVKLCLSKHQTMTGMKILILGFAFKENCPDTRNTKIIDIYDELTSFGATVAIYDPLVNKEKVKKEYGIDLVDDLEPTSYHALILAVPHQQFLAIDFENVKNSGAIIFDTKGFIDRNFVHGRL
ncbi:MAG: nucleotide sugar dehydrogenase [Pedobacter sp.]|nr:nucleotide sugar dehydrogenase [Pedobacter sp.]